MRMIEKIARAIANGTYDNPDTEPDQRRAYRQLAVDVLQAMREPTEKMLESRLRKRLSVQGGLTDWQSMIDAALLEETNANDQ